MVVIITALGGII